MSGLGLIWNPGTGDEIYRQSAILVGRSGAPRGRLSRAWTIALWDPPQNRQPVEVLWHVAFRPICDVCNC